MKFCTWRNGTHRNLGNMVNKMRYHFIQTKEASYICTTVHKETTLLQYRCPQARTEGDESQVCHTEMLTSSSSVIQGRRSVNLYR